MMDYCYSLKNHLESIFSMPFDVISSSLDGEICYTCCPQNEEKMYFDVTIYIHNHIRLIIEAKPQKYGGYILNDMALAPEEKKIRFFQYIEMLENIGAKAKFIVNDNRVTKIDEWPTVWRTFICKITLLPIPDVDESVDELSVLAEWLEYCVELLFSLLTIEDLEKEDIKFAAVQSEGTSREIQSVRYERNSINRKLCLYKKGYNCAVCGFNFFNIYGDIGSHFIEVHHVTPVSAMEHGYTFDVDRDLITLCSNCHSMIHKQSPPFTVEQLKNKMEQHKKQSLIYNKREI